MSEPVSLSNLNLGNHHKIIVGVDYGTTFTGVSYVYSSNDHVNEVKVIRTWPGPSREQEENCKTPSRIAYGFENPSIQGEVSVWGYMVGPRMKSYTWTKLLLDRDNAMKSGSKDFEIIEGNGVLKLPDSKPEAREVCADFLRGVYTYTMEYLKKRHTPPVMKVTPLEFWFTVPAIWSDKAKEETMKAATSAGFGSRPHDSISMITEPEAAAVATLSALSDDELAFKVKVGDGIIICDCGGGTVDIVTYKVKQLKPIIRFEELLPGTGETCGSTYIDREFYKWMSKKFGKAFDSMNADKKRPGSRFMKEFESHKRDFGSSSDPKKRLEIELVIPGAKDSDIYEVDNSVVILTNRIMESFFQPIVAKIKRLLLDQLEQVKKSNASIQTILLVGGFGDSPYLNNSLREWCQSYGPISLLCPTDPQASVVKGAALRGLKGLVPEKRIARVHYGVKVMLDFREQTDPQDTICYWEWDGKKYCNDRMQWLINKVGDLFSVSSGKRLTYNYKGDAITPENCPKQDLLLLHKAGDTLSFSEEIYTSTEDTAPEWYRSKPTRQVATINYTFSESDLALFPVKKSASNQDMRGLCISVQVNAIASKGLLEFRIIGPGGRDMGKTRIDYE
ncbi:unnamed protein product [Penicillium salamii]|uniref:Actin-like ATPase domain-containing protein n=1 Tax=Penicillium salamii TaxID=1612424 RepID=A0A9W4N4J9_9EURO|nr:unnamed protein product [Penicillium salamii]